MRGLRFGGRGTPCPRRKDNRRKKRKLWLSLGVLSSALWLNMAVVAPTRGEDYYEEKGQEAKGLLSGMFNEKPKGGSSKRDNKAVQVRPRPTATVATVEAERQRHQNALMRRMEVCDRLRTIANQTGNEALMLQANELEERATRLYRQQTAGLAVPLPTPLTILAQEQPNPNQDRRKPVDNTPQPLFGSRTPAAGRQPASNLPGRLNGNMDQREQAILNGSSMGGR